MNIVTTEVDWKAWINVLLCISMCVSVSCTVYFINTAELCPSLCPRSLRRGSADTPLLWLRVQIPPEPWICPSCIFVFSRLRLKCDGTRAETRVPLSAKRTSPFKSAETSVHSTISSRGVRFSGSNAGYTMFRGSVKSTGYPIHSPVSPSLPLPCVTMCHYISTGLYSFLHRADHSSRGVLPSVCHWAWSGATITPYTCKQCVEISQNKISWLLDRCWVVYYGKDFCV